MEACRTSIAHGRTSDAGGELTPSLDFRVREARDAISESITTLREKSARGDQVNSTFSAMNCKSRSP